MTVRHLLQVCDSKELSEWAAYYSIEPFGYFRSSDLPAGIIASTLANCNRTRNSRAFAPKDFMPIGEHNKQAVMGEDDMKQVMIQLAEESNKDNK